MNHFFSTDKSEKTFKKLINTYQNRVFRFISLFINDRQVCEELTQDVFVILWQRFDQITQIENLDQYIFIVSKNTALNHLRKRDEKNIELKEITADVFYYTETTPESIFISKETVEQLNATINKLPHKTKIAFLLVREHKMKYKEAAELLGISVKTIEKQVASAIFKLKELLKKEK